jgi:hypothetical protein
MLFFAQTTDSALATCLVANDPAATWAALKALRPAINKAIEDVARVIGALRLADNDVTEYISHHRAANTQRQDMAPDHHHVQVSTQLQRILQGAEGISELNAICLKYGDINDPTAAALTALFSDIRQHAPSHVAARVQANEQDVCAVCDKRDHNAPECYTRALLFKNGRLNQHAISALRRAANDNDNNSGGGNRGLRNDRANRRQRRQVAKLVHRRIASDLAAIFPTVAPQVNNNASSSDSQYMPLSRSNPAIIFDSGASTTMTPDTRYHTGVQPNQLGGHDGKRELHPIHCCWKSHHYHGSTHAKAPSHRCTRAT